jgi:uncharacterized protein YlaI
MRKSVLLVTVVLMSMIWGTLLVADEQMCVPMEITIEPLIEDAKRSEVAFPHAVHFSYSCQECHHKWDTKSTIVNCTTSGCHDLDKAPKTDDGRPVKDPAVSIRYYKKAYHDMCIGCHKKIKKSNKEIEASKASLGEKLSPTGPTGCNQCHPKE